MSSHLNFRQKYQLLLEEKSQSVNSSQQQILYPSRQKGVTCRAAANARFHLSTVMCHLGLSLSKVWLGVQAGVLIDTQWAAPQILCSSWENISKGVGRGGTYGTTAMGTEVAGLLLSVFCDCSSIYRFLSFVDIFNNCLVTASGAASCSTSLDQRALVLKGELPNRTYCPKRIFLTVMSSQLPRSCSRMNEGRPGSAPRSGLECTGHPSPAIPPSSGLCVPAGAVSLLSPCNLGCRSSFHHPPEPVCVALWGGWTRGSHGAAEFMGHVWEKPEEVSDVSV